MRRINFHGMIGSAAAFGIVLGAGILLTSHRGQAFDSSNGKDNDEARIKIGLDISPVRMDFSHKDKNLVGLGSYLVNAVAGCDDCHSAGPQSQYADGGNPFFGQHPTVVNPNTFLGGGRDFGAFPDPAGPFPHVISRNLTPVNGLPAGDLTLDKFKAIFRTGKDPDPGTHPTCKGMPNGTCLPQPFDGTLLQIMPWPVYQNMSDHDIEAIYTYLTSIPCLEGGPGEPANRCK